MHALLTLGSVTDTESVTLPFLRPQANIICFRDTVFIQVHQMNRHDSCDQKPRGF